MIKNLLNFNGINCTLNTTMDCNLRCKYCYEFNKIPGDLDIDTAKLFIDKIFDDPNPTGMDDPINSDLTKGLVIDLIGGDSLMNVDLLDKILSYVNYKYIINDRFKDHGWRVSICSNGTLFRLPKVRKFCEKWKSNLSLAVSIDGCPEIHDANRVDKNGIGSMKYILETWDWYRNTFPMESLSTKATCNKDSIPYLYDSLKFMHESLGLKWIHQNFIMEYEDRSDSDYELLDNQLHKCADYCLLHRNDLYWSMLGPTFQDPKNLKSQDEYHWNRGNCGIGNMPTLAINGDLYPCFRCLPHSQSNNDLCVGNIHKGSFDKEKLSIIRDRVSNSNSTKDPKCIDCEYISACTTCAAGCYSELGRFERLTHICEITKLQCKWARYYKDKLNEYN